MIRAGKLNRRVTIRQPVRVEDEGGGYTETLADVATVPAKVETKDGAERELAMQRGMLEPHVFTVRYRRGITGASELLYDGRRFNVTSVRDPNGLREDLIIEADVVPD